MDINNIVEKWLVQNKKISNFHENDFFKKLIIFWPKIVGQQYSSHSIPLNIAKDNNDLVLNIAAYNGSVALQLQLKIKEIEANIKREIGFYPVKVIKIRQKPME